MVCTRSGSGVGTIDPHCLCGDSGEQLPPDSIIEMPSSPLHRPTTLHVVMGPLGHSR
jgi:hypothetical protein